MDKYNIELNSENWKCQKFHFSFSSKFKEEAFLGFKEKGERALATAKLIEEMFSSRFEGSLNCVGVLRLKVTIPDSWEKDRQEIVFREFRFQLFHVAKEIYNTLQQCEGVEFEEYKIFWTQMGADGIEGLSRKFSNSIKTIFSGKMVHFNIYLERLQESLGDTKFFPISILRKSGPYKTLMLLRSQEIEKFHAYFERDYVFLFRRLATTEDSMRAPLGIAEECLKISESFSKGLERLREKFSSQLEISSTFFEVIGLTITLSGIALSVLPQINSLILVGSILLILLLEVSFLWGYSTGSLVKQELKILKEETKTCF